MVDPVAVIDGDNRLVEANPAAAGLAGLGRDELRSVAVADLVPVAQWRELHDLLARCRAGERVEAMEMDIPAPGGSRAATLPMELTFSLLTGVPGTTGDAVLVVARDLTRIRRTHAAVLSRALQATETRRVESLATFARGLAHDLNNLLAVIQGSAEQLDLTGSARVPERQAAQRIIAAGARVAELARQLLVIGHTPGPELEAIDLGPRLAHWGRELEQRGGHRITAHLTRPTRPVVVLADPALLEEALAAIVANCADAMPDGGEVAIDVTTVTHQAEEAGWAPGKYARLAITDTGGGMAPEVAARALEPMFTTKPRGRGTGMGLAVARALVSSMNGHLVIESAEGEGTTVYLLLPLVPPSDEANG